MVTTRTNPSRSNTRSNYRSSSRGPPKKRSSQIELIMNGDEESDDELYSEHEDDDVSDEEDHDDDGEDYEMEEEEEVQDDIEVDDSKDEEEKEMDGLGLMKASSLTKESVNDTVVHQHEQTSQLSQQQLVQDGQIYDVPFPTSTTHGNVSERVKNRKRSHDGMDSLVTASTTETSSTTSSTNITSDGTANIPTTNTTKKKARSSKLKLKRSKKMQENDTEACNSRKQKAKSTATRKVNSKVGNEQHPIILIDHDDNDQVVNNPPQPIEDQDSDFLPKKKRKRTTSSSTPPSDSDMTTNNSSSQEATTKQGRKKSKKKGTSTNKEKVKRKVSPSSDKVDSSYFTTTGMTNQMTPPEVNETVVNTVTPTKESINTPASSSSASTQVLVEGNTVTPTATPISKSKVSTVTTHTSPSATTKTPTKSTPSSTKTTTQPSKVSKTTKPTKPTTPKHQARKKKKKTFQQQVLAHLLQSLKPFTLKSLAKELRTTDMTLHHLMLSLIDKKIVNKKVYEGKKITKELYFLDLELAVEELYKDAPSCEPIDPQLVEETRREYQSLQQHYKSIQFQHHKLTSELTLTQLSSQVHTHMNENQTLQTQVQQSQERIQSASSSKVKITPNQLKKAINEMRKLWKDRKEKCMDFVDNVADAMEKKVKDVVKLIDLETDEMMGVSMPPKQVIE